MRTLAFFIIFLSSVSLAAAEELSVAGIVEASADVQMQAKASGTVHRIAVKEGDYVKRGKTLVELDNDRERALIDLARAKIQSARAAVYERRLALESSQKDLKRKEIMQDVIARKELENAQDAVGQYEAGKMLRESELREAEAELVLREVDLENRFIKCPFDGVVTEIHVEEGETVRALEDPICDVFALNKMFVKVAVPVGFIKSIKEDADISVDVEGQAGLSGKRLKGIIRYINPTIEPTSRTFRVKIEIVDPHNFVRPGMRANVKFPMPEGALPPALESTR
jgi:RND family efflux transporter MFP subunit